MSEESQTSTNEKSKITIKKSTFNGLIIGIIVIVGVAAFFAGTYVSSLDNNQISNEDLNNAIAKLELKLLQNQLATQQAPQPTQPIQAPSKPSAPQIFQVSVDDDPFKGDPDAPVTVIEFSDFQCPFCARFFSQTLPALEKNYIDTGKIKLVYRDMPIDSLHPNARPAHIAAECADEQGKFWEYHDVLFANQGQWSRLNSADLSSQLNEYATSMELNSASFDSCLSSQSMADEVNADLLESRKYTATGTPTFFIGNEENGFIKLVGAQPFSAFQAAIDAQLD